MQLCVCVVSSGHQVAQRTTTHAARTALANRLLARLRRGSSDLAEPERLPAQLRASGDDWPRSATGSPAAAEYYQQIESNAQAFIRVYDRSPGSLLSH